MPNGGHEHVDWETFREHEQKAMAEASAGFQRLSILETDMCKVKEETRDMRNAIKDLEKTVWKACGAAIAVSVIAQLLFQSTVK